jgi:hypothetical protein
MKQISSSIREHAAQVRGVLFTPDFPKNKLRFWRITS